MTFTEEEEEEDEDLQDHLCSPEVLKYKDSERCLKFGLFFLMENSLKYDPSHEYWDFTDLFIEFASKNRREIQKQS